MRILGSGLFMSSFKGTLTFPYLTITTGGSNRTNCFNGCGMSSSYFTVLETIHLGDVMYFFYGCNKMESAEFPSLKNIKDTGNARGGILFVECALLKNVKFGDMNGVENASIVSSCPNLSHIEFRSLSISIRLDDWYPINAIKTSSSDLVEDTSICSNNIEQFLYNFREYIVKRLAVKSSKTYIYLHATTKSYILGEDDSHYAQTWIVPGESDTYLNTLNDELTARNWGLA